MICHLCGKPSSDSGVACVACASQGDTLVADPVPDASGGSWNPYAVSPVGHVQVSGPTVLVASEPRPWVRFWARTFDTYLIGVLMGLVLVLFDGDLPEGKLFDQAYGYVAMLAWIPMEAALLAFFGTTPGKWLLKVRVRRSTDEYPPFSAALSRSLKVWFRGQAMGIPLIGFFAQIFAYSSLTENGTSSWDKDEGLVVMHERIGVIRILAGSLVFFGLIALGVYGVVMTEAG